MKPVYMTHRTSALTILDTRPSVSQKLVISSLAIAPIASTDCAYPRMDVQAELAWVAWINTEAAHP